MRKLRYKTHLALPAAMLLASAGVPVHAAPLYWDGTDTTVDADGGDGTWDNAATNWDDAATGGADATWTDGDDANFAGTAGNVTVGADIVAGDINFGVAGYTLDLAQHQSLTVSSLSSSSAVITSTASDGSQTFTLNNASDVTWSGTLGNTNSTRLKVVKDGAGTFNFSGNIEVDNGLFIEDGTLRLGATVNAGNGDTYTTLNGDAVLDTNGNDAYLGRLNSASASTRVINTGASQSELRVYAGTSSFDGTVEDNIRLRISNNTGVLILTNSGNTFTGGVNIGDGELRIGNAAAVGTGKIFFGGGTEITSIDSTDLVFANSLDTSAGSSGGYTFGQTTGGTGTLTFTANSSTTLGNRTRDFATNVDTSITHRFTGDDRNDLIKSGDATLTLLRDNTYSGDTTVNAGTLLLNNTSGSGTGDGDVTINAGGRLGGTGFIVPGSGHSVDFSAGGTFLALTDGPLTIDGLITATDGVIATDDTLSLASYTVLLHNTGELTGVFTVDSSITGQNYEVVYNADSVVLQVVPEPATLAIVLGGLACVLSRRRA